MNSQLALPIVVDEPTDKPALGFENYYRGIAAAIRGGSPAKYTIGLYGPWGTGKSSLLKAIQRELDEQDGNYLTVEFDAWRYSGSSSLLLPVLASIQQRVAAAAQAEDRSSGKKKFLNAVNAIGKVISRIELSVAGIAVSKSSLSAFGASIDFRDADPEPPTPAALADYFLPFDSFKSLGSSMQATGTRTVVFIDDLDRCPPDKVVEVLQAVHLLTDVEGIVFVLALDYGYLTGAIRRQYGGHVDPDRYIEKIVQVPFHIPRLTAQAGDVRKIVPALDKELKAWFVGVSDDVIERVVALALRSNPRQVKRLFNTYLLAHHMSPAGTDTSLMYKVFGLQVGWPSFFSELTSELAQMKISGEEKTRLGELAIYMTAMSEKTKDIEPLPHDGSDSASAESRPVGEYLRQLLPESILIDQIRPVIELAAQVTESAPAVGGAFQNALQIASPDLLDLYEELRSTLESFATDSADVELRETDTYLSCIKSQEGRKRVFASVRILPSRKKLVVYAVLSASDMPALGGHFRDVTGKGHHGVGDLEISIPLGDSDSFDASVEVLLSAYQKAAV